jgi:phosphoglycolate phosphatase-like HAD superfamily hydrolase
MAKDGSRIPRKGTVRLALTQYRGVIFDCDDTLIETSRLRWSVLVSTAATFGRHIKDKTIRAAWGKPFDQLIAAIAPDLDPHEFISRYRHEMLNYQPSATKGAFSLLESLRSRGTLLQIVTSSDRSLVEQDLHVLGMDRFFMNIYGFKESSFHKPDPRVLAMPIQAFKQVGIGRNEIVFVGDSVRDYHAAHGNAVDFIGVLTGIERRSEFREAGIPTECVVDDLTFLLPGEIA